MGRIEAHASFLTSARWRALDSFLYAMNELDAPNHSPLDHRPLIIACLQRARSFAEADAIAALGQLLDRRLPTALEKRALYHLVLDLRPEDM